MKTISRILLAIAIGVLACSGKTASAAEQLSPAEIKSLAHDLYFYAYPIVSMDFTMRQATNVPNAAAVPARASQSVC